MPIIKVLADKLGFPQEDTNQAIEIIDSGLISNAVGKERLDKITGENFVYYSLIDMTFCLIALAIFDIILKPREQSRYSTEEPKFKHAQSLIKEQVDRCIETGKKIQPIGSISL